MCEREGCKAYDTTKKTWRHLNFFEHRAYLHARTPRVECSECGVKLVEVPWARAGSDFTLLFEGFVMALVKEMPVKAVARLVGEHDTRLWRILHFWVEEGRAAADFSHVTQVGVDEKSAKRGQNYITLFADLKEAQVLFATEERDHTTLSRFRADLLAHGGRVEQITELCMDVSEAFTKGAREQFPKAKVVFDKFHIMKLMNEAVEEVRRAEQKERPELVNSRYIWIKNPQNLTPNQLALLESLTPSKLGLKTARAYRIRLALQEFWNLPPGDVAEAYLKRWYFWATHSRLPAIIRTAKTLKAHWDGVLHWFRAPISNGTLEAINSLVHAAKARARGYRTNRNLIAMVYLTSGKLDIPVTHLA